MKKYKDKKGKKEKILKISKSFFVSFWGMHVLFRLAMFSCTLNIRLYIDMPCMIELSSKCDILCPTLTSNNSRASCLNFGK